MSLSDDWTTALQRKVAYVDVLGYSAILQDQGLPSERERANRLLDVWNPLYELFSEAVDGRHWIKGQLFSDSLFLTALDPVPLVAVVARIFTGAYIYYEHRGQEGSWMPWLRAGLGSGWVLDIRDPIARAKLPAGTPLPTNPTGPGIADAYYRAENKQLPGMRILVTDELALEFADGAKTFESADASINLCVAQLRDLEWPCAGGTKGLRDVPWWKCDNNGRVPDRVLLAHSWQADVGRNPQRAREHFSATLQLIRS
jgi:hypothetical protein